MGKYWSFFVALGAAVLILVVLQQNQQKKSSTPVSSNGYAAPAQRELLPIGPDEANCPVMGMVGKKAAMVKVVEKGTTYYLCCQECLPKFQADPERYIKYPAPPTSRTCNE